MESFDRENIDELLEIRQNRQYFPLSKFCAVWYIIFVVTKCCKLRVLSRHIKTHSSVSAAKKTKKDAQHTSVLFTGAVKLSNLAFCILSTKPISTKFIYFLLYIYITSHIKIEGNCFSCS